MTSATSEREAQPEPAPDRVLQRLLCEVESLRAREEQLIGENEQLVEALLGMEESRNHYVDLYALSPIPTLVLDGNGAIRTLNDAGAEMFGFSARDLRGVALLRMLPEGQRASVAAHLIECPPPPAQAACRTAFIQGRTGETLPVHLVTRRLDQEVGGYVTSIFDLSELEKAKIEQARLTVAEEQASAANEAKDQFIAVLSHELRTPLTPVLAIVSSYAERDDLPAELKTTFSMLQRNVLTEAQLIDDLLDVTRISHRKMHIEQEPLDVHSVIRDAASHLSLQLDKKDIALRLDLSAARAWSLGDAMRLRQVFWNLLQNALNFTPPAGRVTVRSWNSEGSLSVEVSDNGRGIDPDALGRVFEPFEQVSGDTEGRARGLGLGLAICRGILQLHGAEIRAASAGVGKGARFVVQLPTIDAAQVLPRRHPPSSAPPPPAPGEKTRILLVEDHEDTADILHILLRRAGYEVEVASSLETALRVERSSFDILVSDIGLGDGSGLELMRAFRKSGKLRGIALSGFGTERDVEASKDAGFAAHVTKPVRSADLLEAVARLCGH